MANPPFPDLAKPLRTAIINNRSITEHLPGYTPDGGDGDAVFTRVPVPQNAPTPYIVVGTDIGDVDKGGLNDSRLVIKRDIVVYGRNDASERYRRTETIARAIRDLFHRNPFAIEVPFWKVINIWCRGPMSMPVSEPDKDVARIIEVSVEVIAVIS